MTTTAKGRDLKKILGNLPKDRIASGGNQSFFTSEEWVIIHNAYVGNGDGSQGTALKTIYDALPDPKHEQYTSFRHAYHNWRTKALARGLIHERQEPIKA